MTNERYETSETALSTGANNASEPLATWDNPTVLALAKALSDAEMFYDDRDWLVLAEVALTHLGLMQP